MPAPVTTELFAYPERLFEGFENLMPFRVQDILLVSSLYDSFILREDGRLLVALPAPDDLVELRGAGRDRVARVVETFADGFTLADRRRSATAADLDAAAVQDVLHSIYRPMRSQPAKAMRVTFSLDLLLFRQKPGSEEPGPATPYPEAALS